MLVKNYKLDDIRKYEEETGNNILSYFNEIKFTGLIDLVRLGNNNCSEEEASDIIDAYFSRGFTYVDAMIEIKEKLLGKGANKSGDEEDSSLMDITGYGSLTQLYETYAWQLMSVGFPSYSEFWDLSTYSLYRVFSSIMIKRENDINQSLSLAHSEAGMIGAAVWGKLKGKPPQVKMAKPVGEQYDNMDEEQAIMVAKLAGLQALNKGKG